MMTHGYEGKSPVVSSYFSDHFLLFGVPKDLLTERSPNDPATGVHFPVGVWGRSCIGKQGWALMQSAIAYGDVI